MYTITTKCLLLNEIGDRVYPYLMIVHSQSSLNKSYSAGGEDDPSLSALVQGNPTNSYNGVSLFYLRVDALLSTPGAALFWPR